MRFGNLDFVYADANYGNENQASMIVELKHNNFFALFMGDAQPKTMQYLMDTNFITHDIDFYTIPHHAINNECNPQFYDLINPKIAIGDSQLIDFELDKLDLNQDSVLLYEKGCKNYFSFSNNQDIHFVEKNNNIKCINGKPFPHVGIGKNETTIYVNALTENTVQNGTEEYPFKNLPQALGCLEDLNNRNVTISLLPRNVWYTQ